MFPTCQKGPLTALHQQLPHGLNMSFRNGTLPELAQPTLPAASLTRGEAPCLTHSTTPIAVHEGPLQASLVTRLYVAQALAPATNWGGTVRAS